MSGRSQPQANQFLNASNYNKILSFLRQHYSSKLGVKAVPERMEGRLQNTVQHYMKEIARIQGTTKPLPAMNQEVLRETTSSLDNWLKRQESAAPPTTTTVGTPPKDAEYARLFEDTNSRYENMLAERTPPQIAPAAVPDFRLPALQEEEEDPVVLMQRIQKQRDEQTRSATNSNPPRLQITEDKPPSVTNAVPPQAEAPPPLLAPRPQDYIIPQEDIIKYRETEHNIFLTSSDRDWVRNTAENRYNFSVIFNTGNTRSTLGYNAALQQRFRNIQRIEFVKAIVPIESLVSLVRVANTSGTTPNIIGVYDTSRVVNVFSLPFASVRIAELNNNGFSTKPEEDNTFAIVQYDTTWSSDLVVPPVLNSGSNNYTGSSTNVNTKSGYSGLIPKFLKAQRIYTPTPLATLNKLSIRLERHTTELLSSDSDVLSVDGVFLAGPGKFTAFATSDATKYASIEVPQYPYIFLHTSSYFLYSAVSEGDNIAIQGYTVSPSGSTTQTACDDIIAYINRSQGHYVVATGFVISATGALTLGRNDAGYCNLIILRSRFDNPATTGGTSRTASFFGGTSTTETNLATTMNVANSQTACSLINLSRQVHVVLRVITRDLDSGSNIRPDNV